MNELLANYYDLGLAGEFPLAEKNVTSVKAGSISAGEVVQLQLKLREQKIIDVRFKIYGCGYIIACANQTANWLQGRDITELSKFSAPKLIKTLKLPETKQHCAFLLAEAVTMLSQSVLGE